MEYFLTTYTKDYKWPVPFSELKEERRLVNVEKQLRAKAEGGGDTDPCCIQGIQPIKALEIPAAQSGISAEAKFGQPNSYLKKLYNKYPYLYNILSITPPEELAKIAYADKFMTTYRADFAGDGFEPLKSFLAPEMPGNIDEDLQQAVDKDKSCVSHTSITGNYGQVTPTESRVYQETGGEGCRCPASHTVCTCIGGASGPSGFTRIASEGGLAAGDKGAKLDTSTSQAPVIPKPISITKIPRAPMTPKKDKEDDKPPEYKGGNNRPRLGKWKTEYKDTISRMGGIIIDKKLLTKFPKEDTRLK